MSDRRVPRAAVPGDMEAQLAALYAEKERLHAALGTADADEIIAMVESLDAQLRSLYAERDTRAVSPRSSRRATGSSGTR